MRYIGQRRKRVIVAFTESEKENIKCWLSGRQKDLLKNYMNAQREVSILTDCDTFINGFQIGAKIMLDVLTEGEMREI